MRDTEEVLDSPNTERLERVEAGR